MAQGLNVEGLMESLAGYSIAPELERRCLFVIAASTDPSELQQSCLAFNALDKDRDGKVSQLDLVDFLQVVASWRTRQIDAAALFAATDLDRTGVMTFTKFAAACLHRSLAPLDDWLAQQAFESMDSNGDGLLDAHKVLLLFGELPAGLPYSQPFGFEEWRKSLLATASTQKGVVDPRGARVHPQPWRPSRTSLLDILGLGGCGSCHEDFQEFSAYEVEEKNTIVSLLQVSALGKPIDAREDASRIQTIRGADVGRRPASWQRWENDAARAPLHHLQSPIPLSSPRYVAAG